MDEVKNNTSERTAVGARITIYRRGKRGVYYADYHHNGKHCRTSLKTPNKRLATQRAVKLERLLDDGTFISKRETKRQQVTSITLTQATKEFIDYSETEGRRRKTVVKQRGILNRFARFAAETNIQQLAGVDLRLIDRYRSERGKCLSLKSMHNEGQLLKQFLAWCAERRLIETNPLATRRFRPPKYEPREGPALEQVNLILSSASVTRKPVLATLAFTGARIGEVAHLRIEDVDLQEGWLHFVSRPGYETKTGNSRKVPIHECLRPLLESVIRRRSSGWFFTALASRKYPAGDHCISAKHVNEDFKRLLKSLKLPAGQDGGFTIHSLRRSFKTICVNSGIPREVVDAWQDHAHIRTPGDLYYKLSDADSQRFMMQVPIGLAPPQQPSEGGENIST